MFALVGLQIRKNRPRNARDVIENKAARFMLTVYIRPNLCFYLFLIFS